MTTKPIGLISQNKQLCTHSKLFCAVVVARLKREASQLHVLWRIVSYCSQKNSIFCSCSRFFHCCSFFILLKLSLNSISYRRNKIFMLFFQRNSSPQFFVSRARSLSVMHVSVDVVVQFCPWSVYHLYGKSGNSGENSNGAVHPG